MKTTKALILLVEDNARILRGNERMLTRRGYDTMTAVTLSEARARLAEKAPDAIVLDIILPDGSGLDFLREIRKISAIPILLLTGLTTPQDIVRGLVTGGDDYLTKPYDFSVMLARVEALLRRTTHIPDTLVSGALTLDIKSNRAFIGGADMLLTPKEFIVLLLLAESEGKTVATSHIYETVWRQAPDANAGGAIKTIMSRLRRKLGEAFALENDREADGYVLTLISI